VSLGIFADLPVAVALVTGPDLVVQVANQKYLAMVGCAELAGRSLPTVLPEFSAQEIVGLFRQVLETGEPTWRHALTAWTGHRKGQPGRVLIDAFYQPVRDDSGVVTSVLFLGTDVTGADVTAQVTGRDPNTAQVTGGHGNKELAAVEDRYRTLFNAVPFGVVCCSADGLILEANPAASQISGVPQEDLLTWPLNPRVLREDGTPLAVGESPLEVALRTGEPVVDMVIGLSGRQAAGLRWLKVIAVPYWPDEAGRPQRGYVIFRDVTEQHNKDELLRNSEELMSRAGQARIAAAARERAARAEAQIATERLNFLIRAGELVSVATDREELLSRAAKLVVPGLADLCVTFLPGDGGVLQATSIAHLGRAGEAAVTDLRDFKIPQTDPQLIQAAWEAGHVIVKKDSAGRRAEGQHFGSPLHEITDRMDLRSVIAVPLMRGEQPLGVITLGRVAGRPCFAQSSDIPVVEELGRQLAVGLANADRSAWDHAVAQALQRAVLPDALPRITGLDLAARYLPTTVGLDVGGDWYDVFAFGNGRVGLAVGDVVGHNLAAASVMGQVRNLLRAYAVDKTDPAAVLNATDAALERLMPDALATVVYAVLDIAAGQLSYAFAGHPPPVCVTPEGEVSYLDAGPDAMLGLGGGFTTRYRRLASGSTLLFYTDGLIEDRHRDLGEGLARLAGAVRHDAARSAEQTCAAVQAAMVGTEARADDLCMLAVRLAGDPALS
jgi:PAS domain S-box-containing protein